MKSYKNKIFTIGCAALLLGVASCTGDLDLLPNDPNTTVAGTLSEDEIEAVMAKCYSGIAVSGQGGPDGSSDISGLDGGTSQYTRAIFMMNEFTTDEALWIWADEGVYDLVTDTWGTGNANIYGTYSRLYVHIAICNDYLRNYGDLDGDLYKQFNLEARALRALSYYNVIDLFGNAGFIDETSASGEKPVQYTRTELYNWLVAELEDIIASWADVYGSEDATPNYGRVGLDGVEALLARTYLNAYVFTDGAVSGYAKCAEICEEIIARHTGEGLNGTGLVENYMAVFDGANDEFMPGGGGVNEILWGIPYDDTETQAYGGTEFLEAAAYTNYTWADNNAYMNSEDYGLNQQWTCMHAREQFSDKFTDDDLRWSMWCKDDNGFQKENTAFSDFTNGYAVVKFTNMVHDSDLELYVDEITKYPNTDLPLFRLAEVYLMYTESYIMGGAGTSSKALQYVNYVRDRAGVDSWSAADLTSDNILDERCRELYWENVRRTDLVRHGKFTGSSYNWSWKNNVAAGAGISSYMSLFPIPTNVIAAQPEFEQNPGY